MKPLEEFLSKQSEITIQTLANYIQQYIQEQWQPVLQANQEELLRQYKEPSERTAYETYMHMLFQPVQEQLKHTGFLSDPRFPGSVPTSREWGPPDQRERWLWCVVRHGQKAPLGTIAVGIFHDHTQFRLPRAPGVLALKEFEVHTIIQAISQSIGYLGSGDA